MTRRCQAGAPPSVDGALGSTRVGERRERCSQRFDEIEVCVTHDRISIMVVGGRFVFDELSSGRAGAGVRDLEVDPVFRISERCSAERNENASTWRHFEGAASILA